jgi:hypothetical protein
MTDKAGDMMQDQGKDMVRRMNEIAKRYTIWFNIMGVCAAVMLFANRPVVRKNERIIQKSRSSKTMLSDGALVEEYFTWG